MRKVSIVAALVALATSLFGVAAPSGLAAPLPMSCIIKLTISGSPLAVEPGGNFSNNYAVANSGTGTCREVRLSAYYATDEKYISASPKPTASNYYWDIGTLNPGQVFRVSATMQQAPGGNKAVRSDACASADGAKDSCASITTKIAGTTTGRTAGTASTPAPLAEAGQPPLSSSVNTTKPSAPVSQPPTTAKKEQGIWFWDSSFALPWSENKAKIDQAAANGFNAIYVTVDDYLPDVYDLPTGAAKTQALAAYQNATAQFITYANSKNIAVDAEAGDRNWAELGAGSPAYQILDFVTAYDASHTAAKFRHVQYDIEPYLLPNYGTDESQILIDYVSLVTGLVAYDASDIGISMVIPDFYDGTDDATPNITYGGKTGSTFALLLSVLDKHTNDSMNIMAYRNYAIGAGGSIDVSQDELTLADTGKHSTKILVAQETGNVDPSYVTFYGMSKTDLFSQMKIISDTYANNAAFGGMAVDYIDPFLALK